MRKFTRFCMVAVALLLGIAQVNAASYIPGQTRTFTTNTTVYCTEITDVVDNAVAGGASDSDAQALVAGTSNLTNKWVNMGTYGTSSANYTNLSDPDAGIVDNLPSASSVKMLQIKADGGVYNSNKRVIHMKVTGITGVIAHGTATGTTTGGRGLVIGYNEVTASSPVEGTAITQAAFAKRDDTGSVMVESSIFDPAKTYIISIYAYGGDVRFYAVEFTVPSEPAITVDPVSLDFGSIGIGSTTTQTLNVSGRNLEEAIAISYPDGFSGPASVSKEEAEATGGKDISVVFNPGNIIKSDWAGNIVLSSVSAESQSVPITAVSTSATYTLAVIANPEAAATMVGTGNYPEGEEVEVGYTVNHGYAFSSWSAALNQDGKFVMPAEASILTANFTALTERTVTVSTTGQDGVSATVVGHEDGMFYDGDEVVFTATGTATYEFSHWSDGDTSNPRTLTVNGNLALTAEFVKETTAPTLITINPSGNASLFVEGNAATVTLTFSENVAINDINGITVDGIPVTTASVNGSVVTFDVVAEFGKTYEVAVSSTAIVDLADNFYAGLESSTFTLNEETIPYTWDKTSAPYWISGNVSYQGAYTGSDATCSGAQVIRMNDANSKVYIDLPRCGKFKITMSATGGRTFKLYVDDVEKISTGNVSSKTCKDLTWDVNTCAPVTISVENIGNGGATISAIEITDYDACYATLTVDPTTNGSIEVSPEATDNKYLLGTEVTLTAVADNGFKFMSWTGDVTGDSATQTLTMDADKTVGATFDVSTGIEGVKTSASVDYVKYYTTTGIEVNESATGIIIVKIVYTDGSVETSKVLK